MKAVVMSVSVYVFKDKIGAGNEIISCATL